MSIPRIFRLIIVLSVAALSHQHSFCQSTDYSSYEIAKKYKQDGNFIFAYKHLLIFKYSNIEKLNKPENGGALKQLDRQINELEEYLQQNLASCEIISSRGFSDKKSDSLLKDQRKNIMFKDIPIH